jgi:hypothetical protein
MLMARTALMQLTMQEARRVVRYMQPQIVAKGTVFIREGDVRDSALPSKFSKQPDQQATSAQK